MKNLLNVILLLSLSFYLNAFGASSPLNPAVEDELNKRTGTEKTLVVNVGIDSTKASGDLVSTGYFLPPKSLVIRNYTVTKTQIVSADSNTIAWGCASANDLDTAADYSSQAIGAAADGLASGAASAYVYTSTGCQIKYTVGSGTSGITAGAVQHVIKYLDLN